MILKTLQRATKAVGLELRLELVTRICASGKNHSKGVFRGPGLAANSNLYPWAAMLDAVLAFAIGLLPALLEGLEAFLNIFVLALILVDRTLAAYKKNTVMAQNLAKLGARWPSWPRPA